MGMYPFQNPELSLEERVEDLISRLTLEEKAGFVTSRQAGIERLGISDWRVGCEIARGYVGRTPEEPSTVFPQPIGMAAMFDPDLMYKLGEIAGNETRVYYQKEKNGKLMLFGPTVDMERDPRWGRTEEAYGEDPYLTGQMSIAYTKGLKGEDPFYIRTVPGLKHFCANNNELHRGSCSANLEPRTKHEYYYKAFRPAIMEGGALSLMTAYNELSGVPALLNPDLKPIIKDEWGLDYIVSDGADFVGNVIDHHYIDNHAESIALAIKAGADIMLDDLEVVRFAVLDAIKKGLLTEKELEESIKRHLSIRIRLGNLDAEDKSPYANLPKELVNCDEYKGINNRAAKEQIILLKNEGLLPLKQEKLKKIAVVGPLADKNYMDWYTGFSDYEYTVLEGLKKLIGAEKVVFDNAYDTVAIRSKATGKYLSVKDEEDVVADSESIGSSETFEFHDWDFGSQNLYSLKNHKFISEEKNMKASGVNTYGWFVKEWLRFKNYTLQEGDTSLLIDTWNKQHVTTDQDGKLTTSDNFQITEGKQFIKEVLSDGIARAVKLAKESEVAVVCVGNDPLQVAKECYDRPDLVLPKHQSDLIKAVYEANPNTIVIMISSYPYAVNWEKENIPAMLFTSHAGPELGNAIADVLFGKYNPAGRSPLTWYKSVHELPDIMDYDIIKNDVTYLYYKGEPLYPFGYGLSYSSFRYTNMKVENIASGINNVSLKPLLKVTADIENTSKLDGDEVVQLYFRMSNPRVKRPLRQLCGFQRVHIKAGQTAQVEFIVRESELEFYDVTREKCCVETGEYTFMIGADSRDVRLEETIYIEGEVILTQTLRKLTPAVNYDEKCGVAMNFCKERNVHYLSSNRNVPKHYVKFKTVDLSNAGRIIINAATAVGEDKIRISIDALEVDPIGTIEVPVTGGPTQFVEVSGTINSLEGIHDLYLEFGQYTSILDIRLAD
jgi:beta-glucosidase